MRRKLTILLATLIAALAGLVPVGYAIYLAYNTTIENAEDNLRAIRSYEKAGFVHEGRMRQAEYHGGQFHDVLFMSVLRPEWVE